MEDSAERYNHLKYFVSPNRQGGNYYKDGEFDRDGSLCVEAEKMYWLGMPDDLRELYKGSKAHSALQGDDVPTDLKAALYFWWNTGYRGDKDKADEEFIKFYSKMY